MKGRQHDPLHVDVAAATAAGIELAGQWPLDELPRLVDPAADAADQPVVVWRARFARRRARVGSDEMWLHLQAHADVPRECQRCLQPVLVRVDVDCELRFVESEEAAAALDAEAEYDVLALPPRCNLRTLVEDELLLALPAVPKHERCPQPLPQADEVFEPLPDGEAPANPFAALAVLKQGRKP
jgi:uncharacterized protein